MTKPKKKLPTGPINIPAKALVTTGKDSSQSEENKILENKKQDSRNTISSFTESRTREDSLLETDGTNSTKQEKTKLESLKQVSRKQDSGKQEISKVDSSLTEIEYKKVAMRLSEESVVKLRTMKLSTGIPYEVIVDSFIKNWDILPEPLMNQFLIEAKEERIKRLVAGQEKATKTARKKLEDI